MKILTLRNLRFTLMLLFPAALLLHVAADGVDLHHLPLGDHRVSTAPLRDHIWSCRTQMDGGGAFRDGEWINGDGTWDRTLKVTVDGAVEWANAVFSISVIGDRRQITGNGLPDHTTGIYPIQPSDDAYQYDRNPNRINEQTLTFDLPLNPTLAASASCVGGEVGVMINGVVLFNGFDAGGRDAVAHEIQDSCGGHPQITGVYHYHDLSGCIEMIDEGEGHSALVGYAFDGFGIYGYRGEDGERLSNADLDECHGHTHIIDWEGQQVEMYHYHATAEFPYTVGCYRGTAVRGLIGAGQPPGGGGQPGGNPPPGRP